VPLIVYFHGGQFNSGSLNDVDYIAQTMAGNAIVICVGYPLAPEVHFPHTVEIVFEALQWSCSRASMFGADTTKIFVGGEQAGGNLAAVVAMIARDRGLPKNCKLKGEILIFPILDPLQSTSSMRSAINNPCCKGWVDYLPAKYGMHPYAAPLHSVRLGRLVSTLIITGELDPCRDEAEQYAEKLIYAGVPVQVRRMKARYHELLDRRTSQFSILADTVCGFVADVAGRTTNCHQ